MSLYSEIKLIGSKLMREMAYSGEGKISVWNPAGLVMKDDLIFW